MSVVKVQFTRVENETEVNNTQIKDGQLLYTRDGKLYMDYGNARTKLTSIIELLTVASTAPSECSTGDMYYNTTTNLIYTAIGTDTWGSTGSNPSTKYLYVDLTNAKLYYYDGVSFTSYGGGGSVESDTEMSDSSTNPVQNKVIKEYVDNQISIGSTEPTDDENKIWIDTGEIGSAASEITNEYSESTGLGYSANYVNNIMQWKFVGSATGTTSISLNNINYKELYIIGKAKNNESDTGIWIDFYVIKDILLSTATAIRKGYYYDASTNGMIFINISNGAVELNSATRNGADRTNVSSIDVYYR